MTFFQQKHSHWDGAGRGCCGSGRPNSTKPHKLNELFMVEFVFLYRSRYLIISTTLSFFIPCLYMSTKVIKIRRPMLTPLSGSTLPFTSKMISGVRKNKQIQYGASGRIATLRLNNILSNFQVNVSYELLYLISGHVAEGRGARVGGGGMPPYF